MWDECLCTAPADLKAVVTTTWSRGEGFTSSSQASHWSLASWQIVAIVIAVCSLMGSCRHKTGWESIVQHQSRGNMDCQPKLFHKISDEQRRLFHERSHHANRNTWNFSQPGPYHVLSRPLPLWNFPGDASLAYLFDMRQFVSCMAEWDQEPALSNMRRVKSQWLAVQILLMSRWADPGMWSANVCDWSLILFLGLNYEIPLSNPSASLIDTCTTLLPLASAHAVLVEENYSYNGRALVVPSHCASRSKHSSWRPLLVYCFFCFFDGEREREKNTICSHVASTHLDEMTRVFFDIYI